MEHTNTFTFRIQDQRFSINFYTRTRSYLRRFVYFRNINMGMDCESCRKLRLNSDYLRHIPGRPMEFLIDSGYLYHNAVWMILIIHGHRGISKPDAPLDDLKRPKFNSGCLPHVLGFLLDLHDLNKRVRIRPRRDPQNGCPLLAEAKHTHLGEVCARRDAENGR